jgi:hypothetical protein
MSHALRCGAPRVYASHAGQRGRWYRDMWLALHARWGPFDAFCRQQASAAARLHADWLLALADLDAVRQRREHGRGRRPSEQSVRSYQKRAGLAKQSYDAAERRLEELVKQQSGESGDPLTALLAGGGR